MHKPVLLDETISFLNIKPGLIYVDCTLGAGGHSLEILKRLNGNGILIGIDQDKSTLELAKQRLKDFSNCYLFHANFTELKTILAKLKISKITGGVLLDLGISSMQLDDSERGFSFKSDSILDMRMDKSQQLTAQAIVNKYKEEELANVIYKYGEERYSRRIARSIIQNRIKNGPVKTTLELANIVLNCYPKGKFFKIHPATRTFQAIRIEVNKELEKLEQFLCFIEELLLPPSRLTIISFHSLEDRITKHFLKNNSAFKVLTKKPVIPSDIEIKENPRSRSAKLRAAERIYSEKTS